jgi:hypothetical protein
MGIITYYGAAHLVAVDDRQIPVQHHDVVVVGGDLLQGAGPVPHGVHRHRLAPQPGGDRLGKVLLILHDQHPHALVPLAATGPRPSRTVREGYTLDLDDVAET